MHGDLGGIQLHGSYKTGLGGHIMHLYNLHKIGMRCMSHSKTRLWFNSLAFTENIYIKFGITPVTYYNNSSEWLLTDTGINNN